MYTELRAVLPTPRLTTLGKAVSATKSQIHEPISVAGRTEYAFYTPITLFCTYTEVKCKSK